MKRVEAEAEYNIKRLRNHASLAMWCGNNEIYEGMRYWGWDKKYTDPGIMEGMKQGYDKLFRELLPRKVAELDPDRFYMHGSPYEANWGRPEVGRLQTAIIGVSGMVRNRLKVWIRKFRVL